MIPADIANRYACPVSGIQYPELQPLLRRHNGRLVSCGYYPLLEQTDEGQWVLVAGYVRELLVFEPEDVLVVHGWGVDIWRLCQEDGIYYLQDSIAFASSVLTMMDSLEEPLL
jgi:hypothetical protein